MVISNQNFSGDHIEEFLDCCTFYNVHLLNCWFGDSECLGTDISYSFFENCIFKNTTIRKSQFSYCKFKNWQFINIDFSWSFFSKCEFISVT